MKICFKPMALGVLFATVAVTLNAQEAAKSETSSDAAPSIRALMVTGGCCHDYQNQKQIISEGLSAQVGKIDWTILEYGP